MSIRDRKICSNFVLKKYIILASLITAGYLGNYLSLPLFFGVDFLFGSIAVLIVVFLYGGVWGTLAGIIASLHTILLWKHPYAAIIFSLEALSVSWALRRKSRNLALLDGIYWMFIGIPLVYLFYFYVMGIPITAVVLIMLKQSVNGIFNALIASLLLFYSPIYQWSKETKLAKTFSLEQILSTLLVVFVFFPTLTLIVWQSRLNFNNIQKNIEVNLQIVSTDLASQLNLWSQNHHNALQTLANVAARDKMASSKELQQSIQLTKYLFADFSQIYIVDDGNELISSEPYINTNIGHQTYSPNLVASSQPTVSYLWTKNRGVPKPLINISLPITKGRDFLGNVIAIINGNQIRELFLSDSYPVDVEISLLDAQNKVITSTRSDLQPTEAFDHNKNGQIHCLSSQVCQWLPSGDMPMMVRWQKSFYVQETLMNQELGWTLAVEVPSLSHINSLQNTYIIGLTLISMISLLAIILSSLLSHRLIKPIEQLAVVTTNLPDKLLYHQKINWPDSRVVEIKSLIDNFFFMADLLKQKFREIKTAKERLEERVIERTQELSKTNEELSWEIAQRQRIAEALQKSEAQSREQATKLYNTLQKLQQAQTQLVHTEKMSSLGQLVAGIAHEINNPVSFVSGNLPYAQEYTQDLLRLVALYQQQYPETTPAIKDEIETIELEFLQSDLPKVLNSMKVGTERILAIVQDLRNFSRLDQADKKEVDIHEGIDIALRILQHQLQARNGYLEISVIKDYGQLPRVECYPGQLNQVFLNLLANAIDALRELTEQRESKTSDWEPIIRVKTQVISHDWVAIHIADNGVGISPSVNSKLFDPFFTTKPVGKGTGLGLSISYQIVVERHGGQLCCLSELGQGAEFIIKIPIKIN